MPDQPTAIDAMVGRVLDAVHAASGSREAALGPIRRLLAEFSHERVNAFARPIEAGIYYDCEKIARRLGAYRVAEEIHQAGKLDQVSVTECKAEDIRG